VDDDMVRVQPLYPFTATKLTVLQRLHPRASLTLTFNEFMTLSGQE
jgi:hypothetical protein